MHVIFLSVGGSVKIAARGIDKRFTAGVHNDDI